MAAAEEVATAAVEQADDGRGGGGAVSLLLLFIRTVEKAYIPLSYFLSPAVPERAPNWIVSKTPHSEFSVLQLGYERKKNGEQNAERARRMPDNVVIFRKVCLTSVIGARASPWLVGLLFRS